MKYFNLLLLSLLLVATSCSENTEVPDSANDFLRGYEGVEFEFMSNRPPDDIFEGDEVPFVILLHNKGANHVTEDSPVTVTLSYDKFYFSFSGVDGANKAFSRTLYGKSKEFPFGEIADQMLIGTLRANELQGQIESPESELFVNICYPYKTKFYDVVCVNSDFYYDEERQEVCQVEDLVDSDGQGAPIAVTKVIPRISLVSDNPSQGESNLDEVLGRDNDQVYQSASQTVKPVFEIYIENKNNGVPYLYDGDSVTDFCLSDSNRDLINKVYLNASLNPGETRSGALECGLGTSHAIVTLIDGKGVVYCTLPDDGTITAEYNYLAPLIIELNYVYSEGTSKQVEVIRKFS